MENLSWGLLMLIGLFILCIVIIVIASFYAGWLIRSVYSAVKNRPPPAPPFSKKAKRAPVE